MKNRDFLLFMFLIILLNINACFILENKPTIDSITLEKKNNLLNSREY